VNDVSLQQARTLHFIGVLLPSKRTRDSHTNFGRAVPPCLITLQVRKQQQTNKQKKKHYLPREVAGLDLL